jgi:peptide-methionine (S)-S-oxide reductase
MIGINGLRAAVTLVAAVFFTGACGGRETAGAEKEMTMSEPEKTEMQGDSAIETATFGAGCFWCVEAIFQRLEGVLTVKSGYSGGTVKNPSYKEVCNGTTGHAEVIQLTYDKRKISFDELLEVFWKTHDPTTMNRQGNDIGTQYRSAVFYHTREQKEKAEGYKKKLNEAKAYPNPIITEIVPFTNYYPAEDYHQNYFNQNGGQGYCQYVIQPKVEKFEKVFKDKLKK